MENQQHLLSSRANLSGSVRSHNQTDICFSFHTRHASLDRPPYIPYHTAGSACLRILAAGSRGIGERADARNGLFYHSQVEVALHAVKNENKNKKHGTVPYQPRHSRSDRSKDHQNAMPQKKTKALLFFLLHVIEVCTPPESHRSRRRPRRSRFHAAAISDAASLPSGPPFSVLDTISRAARTAARAHAVHLHITRIEPSQPHCPPVMAKHLTLLYISGYCFSIAKTNDAEKRGGVVPPTA